MERVALVTGGTGLLGSWLVHALISHGYRRVFVLARGESDTSARSRLFNALRFCSNNSRNPGWKSDEVVQVVEGDICKPYVGLTLAVRHELLRQTTDIFHTAALTDLGASMDVLRQPNFVGTENVFRLALEANQQTSRAIRVHHISSITVAGNLQGWFSEDQLACGQHFHNAYEQTKFEAERLAIKYRSRGLNIEIYRPGIITGDSIHGATNNFKTIYQPLRFLAHGLFQEWPGCEDAVLSLVPVDKVAEAILLLSEAGESPNGAWHLVNTEETSLGKLVDVGTTVFACRRPGLIPAEHFERSRLSATQWRMIGPFVPYLNYRLRFRATRTNEVLSSAGFRWPRIDETMLEKFYLYCAKAGFIRARYLNRRPASLTAIIR